MIQRTDNPVVEIHDLTVSYYKKPVLWDINLCLPQGKVIGIIGPNGAGKSTLLKAIMGLVIPDNGYIKLFGKSLDEVRKQVSYVPQKESVDWDFPASVLDVVVMGRYAQLGLFQRPKKLDQEKALECLNKVSMAPLAHRQIAQLSGGQQQRVFLARALAQEAQLYLMDEPFVGVDVATEKMIIDLLQTMAREGKTIIVVHHDLQSAAHYFDWSMLLNMRTVAVGPTQDVLTPALLQETYGGKLTILSKINDLLKEQEVSPRELT
ncbi:MAG: ABC transporter ATP-binding protein [Amoebophilaceae bacterium]|jgi:manganese/zinc/iron transport system ATP- binding protein|nr:ABC transporter ATP-binding protein [Amoebophilaceae bacterium]